MNFDKIQKLKHIHKNASTLMRRKVKLLIKIDLSSALAYDYYQYTLYISNNTPKAH